MSAVSESGKGSAALIKLLVKLSLLPAKVLSHHTTADGMGPIAHFAHTGAFNEWEAIEKVAKALGVPARRIERSEIEALSELLDEDPLNKIPYTQWKSLRAVPFAKSGSKISLLMANPLDHDVATSLGFDLGCQIITSIGRESDILSIIERKLNRSSGVDFDAMMEENASSVASTKDDAIDAMESNLFSGDISAPPIIKLVDKIFSDAIQLDASDIHITPEKDKLVAKARVDGIIQQLFTVPNNLKAPVISRIKLLCGMDISEKRRPQDGRLRLKSGFGAKDLRVSTVPTMYGENIVVRILSSSLSKVSFDALGMPAAIQQKLGNALKGSSRVILVTGPTGSGKTSSLYAALTSVADGKKNIITVEDPIEYRIEGLTQIQVNQKTGVTFAEGLRSILRQDPDVIMLGEIRDLETASIAMQAAQTGHLVLSTVHTNSSPAAVTRLRDLGLPAYLIASSVSTILAQRLVRTLCPHCKTSADPQSATRIAQAGFPTTELRAASGCAACGNVGYRGRIGVYSLLEVDDGVREAIRDEMGEQEIEQRARQNGFSSLWDHAIELVLSGTTSLDEAERVLGPLTVSKHSGAVTLPTTEKTTSVPAAGLARRRLLLVEDDENTRAVLSMLFRDQMFEVVEAENGVDALEKLYAAQPEIIVSDLMMPRMSGLELVQRIRADSRTRTIPVLMLTAASSEDNELNLIGHGADDFVSKTVDTKVMMARVNRLLSRATPVP